MKKILETIGIGLIGGLFSKKFLKKFSRKYSKIKISKARRIKFNKNQANNDVDFVNHRTVFACFLSVFLVIFFTIGKINFDWFKANIFETVPRFDGTTMPVKKVPNWVILTTTERTYTYDQLPANKLIDLPEYNLQAMQNGQIFEKGNEKARNIYVTYPVPNLGNYRLDGVENGGSHPGVDIKIPIGTPIYAIANGTVYASNFQASGFGNYISIAHANVPDLDSPVRKNNIYSNYAHLSESFVKEGENVKKGQLIGKSGNTGMATAPHIHFQIDKESVPFVPYWPINNKNMNEEGVYNHFEAVNKGVGKEEARKNTVHPILFAKNFQDYLGGSLVAGLGIPSDAKDELRSSAPKKYDFEIIEKITEKEITPIPEIEKSPENNLEVSIDLDKIFIPNNEKTILVKVNDASFISDKGIKIQASPNYDVIISSNILQREDFINNQTEVVITPKIAKSFAILATGDFGKFRSNSTIPRIFLDIPSNHKNSESIAYLKNKNIIKGYDDGNFLPDNSINRAESLKMLFKTYEIPMSEKINSSFNDVNNNDWFAKYVVEAFNRGIIKGYEDGSFKPAKSISRAEFMKIATISNSQYLQNNLPENSYTDVNDDDWFLEFMKIAKMYNLLEEENGKINPHKEITRSEVAHILWFLSEKI